MTATSGLTQYWEQGDALTHLVAVLLLAMSLLSWIIALYQALNLRAARRGVSPAIAGFWAAASPDLALAALRAARADTWLSPLALAALYPDQALDGGAAPSLAARASHADRVTRALRDVLLVLQRRIDAGQTWLATIAGAAPFVGLLGTVWGIYHALMGVAGSDQPSITAVAGPVGEALIMTAQGLAVAIPALVAYNLLGRSGRMLHDVLDGFAGDLQRLFGAGEGR